MTELPVSFIEPILSKIAQEIVKTHFNIVIDVIPYRKSTSINQLLQKVSDTKQKYLGCKEIWLFTKIDLVTGIQL